MTKLTSLIRWTLPLMAGVTLACSSDDSTGPRGQQPTATANLTVDASTATAYVALGATAHTVVVADSSTSLAWDLSVNATKVLLNGGTIGIAGVTAYCVCTNESMTSEQVMALTANGQAAAFEAVTASDIPSDASFSATVFTEHPWYRYNLTGSDHQIWPLFHVYLIKRGTSVYKVQFTSYYNASGSPRHVTFRYARIKN